MALRSQQKVIWQTNAKYKHMDFQVLFHPLLVRDEMNTKGQILVPLKSVGFLPLTVAELCFPRKSEFIILFTGRRLSYLSEVYTTWKFHWRVRWDEMHNTTSLTLLKSNLLENLISKDVYESKRKWRVRPSVGGVLHKQRFHTGTISPSSFTALFVVVKHLKPGFVLGAFQRMAANRV